MKNLDLIILIVQWIAAIFMGADYLLSEKHRQNINGFLSKSALQYQKKLNNFCDKELVSTDSLMSIVFFGVLAGAAWFYSKNIMTPGFFSMLLFGLSSIIVISVYSFAVPQLFVSLPAYWLKFIAWFIHRCPKGAVFGVGYLMLMLSFTLRLYEATN